MQYKVSVGDFVFFGMEVGEVVLCVQEGDRLGVLVEVWRQVMGNRPHGDLWQRSTLRRLWPAEGVEQSLAWRFDAGGLTVLRL